MDALSPGNPNVCVLFEVGDVEINPLLPALNEKASTLSLVLDQYTLPFQYAGTPQIPLVAPTISCQICGSLPLHAGIAFTQYFPMLLRSSTNIVPSLPICANNC